jgi:hypothetical protein
VARKATIRTEGIRGLDYEKEVYSLNDHCRPGDLLSLSRFWPIKYWSGAADRAIDPDKRPVGTGSSDRERRKNPDSQLQLSRAICHSGSIGEWVGML